MRNRKINLIDDIINNNPDLYLEKKSFSKRNFKDSKDLWYMCPERIREWQYFKRFEYQL